MNDNSVLQDAEGLINGARQSDYGHPADNFYNIAQGWNVIILANDGEVDAECVALMMAWVKICRQLNKPSRDNLVDGAGYLGTIELIQDRTQ